MVINGKRIKIGRTPVSNGYYDLYGNGGTNEQLEQSFKVIAKKPAYNFLSATPDTGFYNDGSDTHPFLSGHAITYTVQTTNELAQNIIYYWRVRAYNGVSYGSWSTEKSFTTTTKNMVMMVITNV